MADFKSIWDSILKKDNLPDIVASVTNDALNDYLAVHRNHKGDQDLYRRDEVFVDPKGKTLFEAIIIVGGNQAEHDNGSAQPLSIELGSVAASSTIGMAYQYPSTTARKRASDKPNAVIRAPNVSFNLSWPSTTSTTAWSTELTGIDFELDVNLQFKEVEGEDGKPQQVLYIEPIKLVVTKQSLAEARQQISSALAHQKAIAQHSTQKAKLAAPPKEDQKVQDLFIAILNLAATYVGPNLARAVNLPLLHISQYELRPTFLEITKSTVNVGAKLNLAPLVDDLSKKIDHLQHQFWLEVENDLASQKSAAVRAKPKFPRAEAFLRTYREGLEQQRQAAAAFATPAGKLTVSPRRGKDQQVAVAANQFLINMIASKIGNVHDAGRTAQLSLWPPVPIRGSAGYEINVGALSVQIVPITSDPAGHGYLKGSAPIDLFAGIYYQIWGSGCSPDWGDEHKIGLGVSGTPSLSLATKPSNGLSIVAHIDLSGVSFNAGMGSPIDDLVGALLSPLMGVIQAICDVITFGMSFIVFRAVENVPHQQTAIALSEFNTYQYSLKGAPASDKNNYAMFVANTAAQ